MYSRSSDFLLSKKNFFCENNGFLLENQYFSFYETIKKCGCY